MNNLKNNDTNMKNKNTESRGFFHFIAYNNFFVILVGAVFVIAGTTFAANPSMVVSQNQQIVSVDNSRILAVRMSSFDPTPRIVSVSEDPENYYVLYTLKNIGVIDYVWSDFLDQKTLKVSKAALKGEDLGLWVAREMGQVVDREISYLSEVQKKEKEIGRSNKVASVTYSGLAGRFFDKREKVFPSYNPVVRETQEIHPQSVPSSADNEGDERDEPDGPRRSDNNDDTPSRPLSESEIESLVRKAIEEYFRNKDGEKKPSKHENDIPVVVTPFKPDPTTDHEVPDAEEIDPEIPGDTENTANTEDTPSNTNEEPQQESQPSQPESSPEGSQP